MESLWNAIAIAIAAVMLFDFARRRKRSNGTTMKWPPGPSTLPIIGNMHQLAKHGESIHATLAKLAQVHGRLMTIWFGRWNPSVIVSDHQLAWEVLVSKSPDYADREFPFLTSLFTADFRTIVSSNAGSYWHSLRKGLQNSGLGPLSIATQTPLQESDMAQMIKSMIQEASSNGGIVKPFPHIRRATTRLLARLCFGSDFSDESFNHAMDVLVEDTMSCSDAAHLIHAFPPTRFLPSIKRTINKTSELKRRISEFLKCHLSSPLAPNCYAQFLLAQNYPEEVVIFSIFEVFLLGVDSTGSTTMWALALLVQNQEAQRKLYQEIRGNSSGTEKELVKVEEVSKMQYLQAVVKETMRMKPIAPLAVPHKAARDTMLNGTRVPAGTSVKVNLYALHHDPKVWVEPYRFMPERFMESSRQYQGNRGVVEQLSFMPFGAGMRACAGMEVGKLQVALAVSNLVNAFQWSNAFDGKGPDLSEDVSFVLGMKTPLEAKIMPRGL